MLRHKNIERICCLVLALTILVTCLYMAAAASGLIQADSSIGYEKRLFDQSCVHTIDIVMDDWQGFLDTCTSEEYVSCTLVIDGESYKNVAIRGKGNTSLSSVASYGNDRYSFKVEFDHYQTGKSYYGLDKLSLNNLIYDNTYMKDCLAYTLMNKMGVASPLCSFVEIRVNGETFGTYLAVEGVEDSFLQRNYGSDHGELYKPDTMNFGGGRGNGRNFNMEDFMGESDSEDASSEQTPDMSSLDFSQMPDMSGFDPTQMGGFGKDMQQMQEVAGSVFSKGGKGMDMGMGSSETKLQYIDDDPESYSNIFTSAKTNIDEDDQARLIEALKKLSEGDTSAVDQEAMLRYLAVHDFLQNGDSYTGSMVHNYYLYEEDGVLSMIPWDYNLAYGTFQGSNAQSTVNSPIDSPVNGSDGSDRPMVSWIFDSEESIAAYHEIYQQFISDYCLSGWLSEEIERVTNMLTPYVANDPTAFCTLEEFEAAAEALQTYCELRAQSVQGQLDGSIPSTTEGQSGSSALVDASALNLSTMGSMGGGRMQFGGDVPTMPQGGDMSMMPQGGEVPMMPQGGEVPMMPQGGEMPTMPQGGEMPTMPQGGEVPTMPQGGDMSTMPQGGEVPTMPQGGEMPTMPQGGDMSMMPQGGDMSTMPQGGDMSMMPQGGEMPTMPQGGEAPTMPQGGEAPVAPDNTQTPATDEASAESDEKKSFARKDMAQDFMPTANAAKDNSQQLLMLIICAAALAVALIAAKLFKRNN